jgi:hypothetical protein
MTLAQDERFPDIHKAMEALSDMIVVRRGDYEN